MESHKIEILKQEPKKMTQAELHQFYVGELKRATTAVQEVVDKLATIESMPVQGQALFKSAELKNTIYVGNMYLKSLARKVVDTG